VLVGELAEVNGRDLLPRRHQSNRAASAFLLTLPAGLSGSSSRRT
jgi:hypothetical protein